MKLKQWNVTLSHGVEGYPAFAGEFIGKDGEVLLAIWFGGEYIQLSFHGHDTTEEVINVWDYETGMPKFLPNIDNFISAIEHWIETQNDEDPEWYEQYLRNR